MTALLYGSLGCKCRGRPFDRNRVRSDHRLVATDPNRSTLAIDPALHEAVGCFQEIVAVELRMKPEKAATQQPLNDLLAPRADAECFGVGPGNMPEGQDGCPRQLL